MQIATVVILPAQGRGFVANALRTTGIINRSLRVFSRILRKSHTIAQLRILSALAQKTPGVNLGMNEYNRRFRLRYFIATADPP